jgi:hypothetical protein
MERTKCQSVSKLQLSLLFNKLNFPKNQLCNVQTLNQIIHFLFVNKKLNFLMFNHAVSWNLTFVQRDQNASIPYNHHVKDWEGYRL